MNKHTSALAAGLFLMPMAANAAPIEQIECVYNAVPEAVRIKIDEAAVEDSGISAFIERASETALATCMESHKWSDADAENATQYFMMRSIAESSERTLALPYVKIVQGYFGDNAAEFVARDNFLESDPDRISADLEKRGIPAGDEKIQTQSAMYLYWLVITQQLRSDFVTGILRE